MGQERFSIPAPTRYKLTIDEFLALDEAGFFQDKGRFELLDGGIYRMSPIHVPHADALMEIGFQVRGIIEVSRLDLKILSPVSMRLGVHSMPEPDLVLVKAPIQSEFVEIESALLAIEVAAASLRYDLKRKAPLYARHGVPELWVVDLKHRQIHQMTDPGAKGYATTQLHPFGARVVSKIVPQIALDSARLA